jgi:hypothetical protein
MGDAVRVLRQFVSTLLDGGVAAGEELQGTRWLSTLLNHTSGEILELRAEIKGDMRIFDLERKRLTEYD